MNVTPGMETEFFKLMVLTAIGCAIAWRGTLYAWEKSGKPLGPNARLALGILYGTFWLVVTGNFLYLFYPKWLFTFVATALPGWAVVWAVRRFLRREAH